MGPYAAMAPAKSALKAASTLGAAAISAMTTCSSATILTRQGHRAHKSREGIVQQLHDPPVVPGTRVGQGVLNRAELPPARPHQDLVRPHEIPMGSRRRKICTMEY